MGTREKLTLEELLAKKIVANYLDACMEHENNRPHFSEMSEEDIEFEILRVQNLPDWVDFETSVNLDEMQRLRSMSSTEFVGIILEQDWGENEKELWKIIQKDNVYYNVVLLLRHTYKTENMSREDLEVVIAKYMNTSKIKNATFNTMVKLQAVIGAGAKEILSQNN